MSKRTLCLIAGLFLVTAGWILTKTVSSLQTIALAQSQQQQDDVIVEQVNITRQRRIPESTIKIWISTREGDVYNPAQLDRDVRAIYAQGYFDDVKVFAEDGARGGKIVTFEVQERPLLLEIKYTGLKSVQQSTVLEEFRKRQVGLSKESQYDPVKARRAAAVIKELLGNEGRPEAKVEPLIEQISQTAVGLTFKVEEGPRYRVADIEFEGNTVYSDDKLRGSMKFVKQIGLLTTFSSKDIYHKDKLQIDLDRLRVLTYADNGFLQARFGEPRVDKVGRVGSWVPLIGHKGEGLKIIIPINEGRQYRAGEIKIEDNKEFTAEQIKGVLNIKPGDVVKGYTVVQKGLENLKKLYGTRGYIQFNSGFESDFKDDPNDPAKGIVDLTFVMEEGKQYTLRRLEFIGNTFTRDSVLRREVLLNEGDRYNKELFDYSVLRLNQLGYFNQVKEEDATVNTNEKEGYVDLTVKVEEKGRQQISFTGGVSGIGGSFIGIDYSTNNLLGYGESLSFQVAAGNRQKVYSFGFTEPYLRGRPISLGFNVFYQDYQFFGQGITAATSSQFLNNNFSSSSLFTQKTVGFSVSSSAPLSYFTPKFKLGRFVRLGLSFAYRNTDILDPTVLSDNDPANDFPVTFRQKGVKQATITPTLSYNTLNASIDPSRGASLTFGTAFSGSFLGGDVNTIEPTVEYKYFRPFFAGKEAAIKEPGKVRTLGVRAQFGYIGAFGKRFDSNSFSFVGGTPLYSRFFLGGEYDIRGYNVRSISPTAPIRTLFNSRNVVVTDLSGNPLRVRSINNATSNSVAPSVIEEFTVANQEAGSQTSFPVFLGGDTQALLNVEYRIPIFGPVAFAPFFDIGSAFNLRKLEDQFITSEFVPSALNGGAPIILNNRGARATARELRQGGVPELGTGLPPGFKFASIIGDQQSITRIVLSDTQSSFLDNYRYSLGGELRVQVPVINVPFRLIFAWNPNAKTDNFFVLEEKRVIRFSVGRTF